MLIQQYIYNNVCTYVLHFLFVYALIWLSKYVCGTRSIIKNRRKCSKGHSRRNRNHIPIYIAGKDFWLSVTVICKRHIKVKYCNALIPLRLAMTYLPIQGYMYVYSAYVCALTHQQKRHLNFHCVILMKLTSLSSVCMYLYILYMVHICTYTYICRGHICLPHISLLLWWTNALEVLELYVWSTNVCI